MESTFNDFRRTANNWWVFLISGILLIILGIAAFINPVEAYLGLSIYFAAVILVNGVSGIYFSISHRVTLQGWGWLLILGIAEVLLGLYLLAAPLVAMSTLAFFIGFWLLFRSSITISNAIAIKNLGYNGWGWVLATGIIGALFGLLVLFNPSLGAFGAAIWMALALLTLGIAACILAFRLRGTLHEEVSA